MKPNIWLLPISWIYTAIVWVRNQLYNTNLLKVNSFDIPIITIGNLSVGGTGKTPHAEYIAKFFLNQGFSVGVVSRGYKRKTKGVIIANEKTKPQDIGDEPFQIFNKMPSLYLAVAEKRKAGIDALLKYNTAIDIIILDDAFQHRSVKAGLNILLSDYHKPFFEDIMLPAGTLREPKIAAQRADMIVVTKTPAELSIYDKKYIETTISPMPHQQVLFSYVDYLPVKTLDQTSKFEWKISHGILLVTGIAYANGFYTEVKKHVKQVKHLNYPDHYEYSLRDLEQIEQQYHELIMPEKWVLTTEKDFVKLAQFKDWFSEKGIKLAYWPIEITFNPKDKENLEKKLLDYARNYKTVY